MIMCSLKQGDVLQSGRYKIIRVLGQGGFGITYLAEQVLMEHKVCIKEFFMKEYSGRDEATTQVTLGTENNRDIVQKYQDKFIKEARLIAKLDHPNIIRIIDVFEENGTAYYVMDYIEGCNLNDLVKHHGAIPEADAIRYIKAIGEGLSYVHSKGINHLDIKPGNIMVKSDGDIAILIDFGMSKQYRENGEQTSSTPVGVSAGYAPLEMYRTGGISTFSPQTDIYELGATLYRLVTGNVPPEASEIADDGIPAISSDISITTRKAIEKAMEFRKKDRPSNVEEFLAMLEDVEEDESTSLVYLNMENVDSSDDSTTIISSADEESKEESNKKTEVGEMRIIMKSYSGSMISAISAICSAIEIKEEDAFSKLSSLPCELISGISIKDSIRIGKILENGSIVVEIAKIEVPVEAGDKSDKSIEENKTSSKKTSKIKTETKKVIEEKTTKQIPDTKLTTTRSSKNSKKETVKLTPVENKIIEPGLVDLGLSVLWADFNLGASKPEEFGNYYAWGETKTKESYRWSTYKFCKDVSFSDKSNIELDLGHPILTKYNSLPGFGEIDNLTQLEECDDIAHVALGKNWKIPSKKDWEELMMNCDFSHCKINGIECVKVQSKKKGYEDKCIFLPFAGYRYFEKLEADNSIAKYYSSSCDVVEHQDMPRPWAFTYSRDYYELDGGLARTGLSIRPVFDSKKLKAKAKVKEDKTSKAEELPYVDLGLSVKWAKCNIGANKPEEQGDFYAWGETKSLFDPSQLDLSYKFGYKAPFTKYQPKEKVLVAKHLFKADEYKTIGDGKTVLEPCDDVATKLLKGKWRMPTIDEMYELIENCTVTKTRFEGEMGYKFVSKINGYKDNWIFLPYCSWIEEGVDGYRDHKEYGIYWSSSLTADDPNNADGLSAAASEKPSICEISRRSGNLIRPVLDDKK